MPLLTKSFHVLIKVLAVDQFPGGTEGVDHGEGFFLTGRVISKNTLGSCGFCGFCALTCVIIPLLITTGVCVWAGPGFPLAQEILSGFFLIGYLNWVMVLLTPWRSKV